MALTVNMCLCTSSTHTLLWGTYIRSFWVKQLKVFQLGFQFVS